MNQVHCQASLTKKQTKKNFCFSNISTKAKQIFLVLSVFFSKILVLTAFFFLSLSIFLRKHIYNCIKVYNVYLAYCLFTLIVLVSIYSLFNDLFVFVFVMIFLWLLLTSTIDFVRWFFSMSVWFVVNYFN